MDSPTYEYLKNLISGGEKKYGWDHEREEIVQRAWLSVGDEVGLFAAYGGSFVAVQDEAAGATVIGRAPVEDILSIRVTESFDYENYQAKIEIRTKYATLIISRDDAARARAKLAKEEDPREEYIIIDSFLDALGCNALTNTPQTNGRNRLGLTTRVRTFSMLPLVNNKKEEEKIDLTHHADVKATLIALEEENKLQENNKSSSQDTHEIIETHQKLVTDEKSAEDAAYEKLRLRAELRWGGGGAQTTPQVQETSRNTQNKSSRQVYRGSWLATVHDPEADAGLHHFLPPSSPPQPPSSSSNIKINSDNESTSESESSLSTYDHTPVLRERYRDVLNSATKSAAKKAADVSRAALSVHADAERLESQLASTQGFSTQELESNLSLAADGAREARSRLAALEREVAMLAGPTLRELAWAAQLRRTADARLARDLSADWNRQGSVIIRYASWNDTQKDNYVRWQTRVWLELEAGDNNGIESRKKIRRIRRLSSGSTHSVYNSDDDTKQNMARFVGDAAVDNDDATNIKNNTKDDRLIVRLEPQGEILFEFLLTEDIQVRRCKDRDAPLFALELLPKSFIDAQTNAWNNPVATAVANFFEYFKPNYDNDDNQSFAFAPETLDEQRCWSLAIEQSLKDAKMPDLPEEDGWEDDADVAICRESLTTEHSRSDKDRRRHHFTSAHEDSDSDDDIFNTIVQSPPMSPKSDEYEQFFDARAMPPEGILSDASSAAVPKKKPRLSEDNDSLPDEQDSLVDLDQDSKDEDNTTVVLAPPPHRSDISATTNKNESQNEAPITPASDEQHVQQEERESIISFSSNIDEPPRSSVVSKIAQFTQQVPPTSTIHSITTATEETPLDVQPRSSSVSSKLALFTQQVPSSSALGMIPDTKEAPTTEDLEVHTLSDTSKLFTKQVPPTPANEIDDQVFSTTENMQPRSSSVSSKLALFTQQVPPTSIQQINHEEDPPCRPSSNESRSSSISSKLALFTQQVPPSIESATAINEEDVIHDESNDQPEKIAKYKSKLAIFTQKVPATAVQVSVPTSTKSDTGLPLIQVDEERRPSSCKAAVEIPEDTGLPESIGNKEDKDFTMKTRPISLPIGRGPGSGSNKTLSPKKRLKMFKQAFLDQQRLASQLDTNEAMDDKEKQIIRRVGSIEVDQASSDHASPTYPEERKSFFENLESPTLRVVEMDGTASTNTMQGSRQQFEVPSQSQDDNEQNDHHVAKLPSVAFADSVKESSSHQKGQKLSGKAKSFSIGTRTSSHGTKRRNRSSTRAQLLEARERLAKQTREKDGDFDALTNVRRQLRRAHTFGSTTNSRKPVISDKPNAIERPLFRKGSGDAVARRLREHAKSPPKSILVVKRPDTAKKNTRNRSSSGAQQDDSPAKEMIRELERGSIVTIRFVPATKSGTYERYEYECIDSFEIIDDEILAPLVEKCQKRRPSLQKLYSAWRSAFSVKTDPFEFRSKVQCYMISQVRRWLASCTLLEIERSHETCVALVRLHDDPSEYVQPIKFGDAVINWAPKRDDGSMSFNDRATSNAVVVAGLSRWLDENRVTAQRTLRIDTANAAQSDDAPLNYERVYRKLFQKAVTF
uniref:Uncharacterized protein n=1 Tax=Aureoumbra lagunensis TaxID=44058 RepID=A0A7S3JQN6_9STRA|mmetsp:Transcript_14444/g.21814  ORF Transcript_14444/g.21814 Transcript_14444/m.21814 type:complete len:1585 (-) Transcript_14444:471-5225(-)